MIPTECVLIKNQNVKSEKRTFFEVPLTVQLLQYSTAKLIWAYRLHRPKGLHFQATGVAIVAIGYNIKPAVDFSYPSRAFAIVTAGQFWRNHSFLYIFSIFYAFNLLDIGASFFKPSDIGYQPSTFNISTRTNLDYYPNKKQDSKERDNRSRDGVQPINPIMRVFGGFGFLLLLLVVCNQGVKALLHYDGCKGWFIFAICAMLGVGSMIGMFVFISGDLCLRCERTDGQNQGNCGSPHSANTVTRAKAGTLRVRVTPDELWSSEIAAGGKNQTVSQWIRETLKSAY